MRKYIDSEELKSRIMRMAEQDGNDLFVKLAEFFCHVVDEMPAADVEERRRPKEDGEF